MKKSILLPLLMLLFGLVMYQPVFAQSPSDALQADVNDASVPTAVGLNDMDAVTGKLTQGVMGLLKMETGTVMMSGGALTFGTAFVWLRSYWKDNKLDDDE